MLKQLFIPVAAFAVTVTGAAAFGNVDWSEVDADLTSSEITALEEAQDIREAAREEAQSVLEDAGIDDERMREIHESMHGAREAAHEAMRSAIEAEDYDAFLEAIADTPFADAITSEEDFEKFVEVHELRESGDHEGAEEIMSELGIERPEGGRGGHGGFGGPGKGSGEGRQSGETE